jgi:hypothetical protein
MYSIENLICDRTYGGIYTMSDIVEVNNLVQESALANLEKSYGDFRPTYSEVPRDFDGTFPPFIFIAWLSDDNFESEVDEEGDEYDGKHLFVIGFTEKLENLVDDIKRMGDKYFDKFSVGFFH